MNILEELKKILIEKIENNSLSETELEEILERIFPFIKFKEFQNIIYSILTNISFIPLKYFDILKSDNG
jgi:hypothetical protein